MLGWHVDKKSRWIWSCRFLSPTSCWVKKDSHLRTCTLKATQSFSISKIESFTFSQICWNCLFNRSILKDEERASPQIPTLSSVSFFFCLPWISRTWNKHWESGIRFKPPCDRSPRNWVDPCLHSALPAAPPCFYWRSTPFFIARPRSLTISNSEDFTSRVGVFRRENEPKKAYCYMVYPAKRGNICQELTRNNRHCWVGFVRIA